MSRTVEPPVEISPYQQGRYQQSLVVGTGNANSGEVFGPHFFDQVPSQTVTSLEFNSGDSPAMLCFLDGGVQVAFAQRSRQL